MVFGSTLQRLLGASLIFIGTAHASTGDWAQYQGNAQHTGLSHVTLAPQVSLAWQTSFAGNINPVTAAAGKVFVSTQTYFGTQMLMTLDAGTGATNWSKDFGSIFSVNPPSYANGTVYVQTGNHAGDTYLRGYDAQSGDLLLRSAHAAQWEHYGAPTIFNGNVYVNGGYYGGAYSFEGASGNQRWFQSLEQYDGWTPAVDATRVVVYTGGNLRVLNPSTGSVMSTITDPAFSWMGWSHSMAPVLAGDHAYVSVNGRLASFDLVNGRMDWALNGVNGQLAIDGSELFTIRNGAIASLDATDGSTNWLWEDPANSNLSGEVIVTENLLLVSSSTKTYLINRTTHHTVQTLDVGGRLALGNDQLYIASGSNLFAYTVTPVPEPASWLLMAGGGFGLLVRRRARRIGCAGC